MWPLTSCPETHGHRKHVYIPLQQYKSGKIPVHDNTEMFLVIKERFWDIFLVSVIVIFGFWTFLGVMNHLVVFVKHKIFIATDLKRIRLLQSKDVSSPWVFSCSCLCRCPTAWRWSWLWRWPPSGCRRSGPALRSCLPPRCWSPIRCSHTPEPDRGVKTTSNMFVCLFFPHRAGHSHPSRLGRLRRNCRLRHLREQNNVVTLWQVV